MSEEKQSENDPERTLLTLDQLSQTIEVMTNVVNRLRQHLSEQLKEQAEAARLIREEELAKLQADAEASKADAGEETSEEIAAESSSPSSKAAAQSTSSVGSENKESFVVEIRQQDSSPSRKSNKTLH
jgi:hypothetical protein